MVKRYLPELLASIGMSVMLLCGYAMRGQMPWPTHFPTPRAHVERRFLLEVENGRGVLRVSNRGEVTGPKQGKLGDTDFNDLRLAVQKLKPGGTGGTWKVRFYDEKGAHEASFEPAQADADLKHVLDNLRILGYLEVQSADQKPGQGRAN